MRLLLVALAAAVSLCAQNATVLRVRPSSAGIGEVRWYDSDASHYVGLKSKGTVSTSLIWSLPNTDGSANYCLITDGSLSLSFAACAAGSTPPFDDDNPLVRDETDNTKELLLNVSGFTTATQRTVTVPNASFIMAGQNLDNAFSANQTFGANILFDSASTRDIGDATNYVQTLYVENISASPSGVTGNYANVRKFEISDEFGGTSFWDFQVQRSGSTVSLYYVRDNAGTVVHRLVQKEVSIDINEAQYLMHLVPGNGTTAADNTYDVGTATRSWRNGYFDGTMNTYALAVGAGGCTGCGSGLPTVDTTSIVEGSVDATKEVRIEADGITTGTVRVWTAPNANITVAGIDLAQTWTALQTYNAGIHLDTAGGPVSFSNATGLKLMLFDGGVTSKYGMSIAASQFQIHRAYNTDKLSFGYGSGGGYTEQAYIDNVYLDIGDLWLRGSTSSRVAVANTMIPTATNSYDLGSYGLNLYWKNLALRGMAVFSDGSSDGGIRMSSGVLECSNNLSSWTACVGSGSTLPVVDTTGIAKGSSDATKIVRLEVDGLTSGVTRIMTAPNADITIAGINLAQTWTASQAFAAIQATSITGGSGFTVDGSGNTQALSLNINGTSLINSSRQWIGNLLFSSDNTYTIGSASANRPSVINAASSVDVYAGSVLRASMTGTVTYWKDGASATTAIVDSSTGHIYTWGSFFSAGVQGVSTTSTVRDSAGTGTCTMIFSGGIRTGGTC